MHNFNIKNVINSAYGEKSGLLLKVLKAKNPRTMAWEGDEKVLHYGLTIADGKKL